MPRQDPRQDPKQTLELEALAKACAGLEYPSESDAPFDVVHWEANRNRSAREEIAARAGAGRTIEEVPIERFFADLASSEDADRFHQLRQALESYLSNVCIFRAGAGEVCVDVYLLGRLHSGDWAGLHTTSTET